MVKFKSRTIKKKIEWLKLSVALRVLFLKVLCHIATFFWFPLDALEKKNSGGLKAIDHFALLAIWTFKIKLLRMQQEAVLKTNCV